MNSINIDGKLNLLLRPAWKTTEIREYFSVGLNKAMEIRDLARTKRNGSIPYSNIHVTTESVMMVCGTTREREIDLLKRVIDTGSITTYKPL